MSRRRTIHDCDPNGEHAPRPRCRMRGCRQVLTMLEAQAMLCTAHALQAWAHVQRTKHLPDYLPEAVKLYERKIAAEAWADESKRLRTNPRPADYSRMMREIREDVGIDDPPPPKYKPDEDIYYLRLGGLIKIGFSTQLYDRLFSYGPTAEILAHHPGTRADERDLHRTFRPLLAKGREWYNPGQILLDHIDSVIDKHGVPMCIPEWSTPAGPAVRGRRSAQAKPTGLSI